jgi:hypothetical protein
VRAWDLRNLSASVLTISSRQKTTILQALAMVTVVEWSGLQNTEHIIYSRQAGHLDYQ